MGKHEETTSRLEETLREIGTDKAADAFIKEHGEASTRSFAGYMNTYIGEHGLKVSEIAERSGRGDYVYQIINGRRQPTNRNYVISLCIASGMSVKETDRALRLAGHNPLSPKDERDVRIVVCINKGMNKLIDVNLELDRYGLEPL